MRRSPVGSSPSHVSPSPSPSPEKWWLKSDLSPLPDSSTIHDYVIDYHRPPVHGVSVNYSIQLYVCEIIPLFTSACGKKSFPSHKAHRAALITVSLAPARNQFPLLYRPGLVHGAVCLFSPSFRWYYSSRLHTKGWPGWVALSGQVHKLSLLIT